MSEKTGRPRRLRFRTRLGLAIAILLTAVSALLAWGAYIGVRRVLERGYDDRLRSLAARIERRLDESGREIVGQLERLERDLTTRRTELFHELARPEDRSSPRIVDAAATLLDASTLGFLEILDADGVVLSSSQWPERAGHVDPRAIEGAGDRPLWTALRAPGGEHPALVAPRAVRVGELEVGFFGGRVFTAADLRSWVGPGEAILIHYVADLPVATDEFVVDIREGRQELRDTSGSPWDTARIALPAPGEDRLFGVMRVAVDRGSLEDDLTNLRNLLVALVVAATVVGGIAGRWLARRATRPVDEAIAAVEAIAAGEADYSFPWTTEDQLEELPQAFSRLHRSLDEQQRRRAAAERVAAWREVARRVAHEVKNPLAPIRITIQNLVKARRQAPEQFDEIFDEGSRAILEEVDQLQRIVTEFSEFARLPEPRRAPVDLDDLVDEVVALYSQEPRVAVERIGRDRVPAVDGDSGLLSRAIKNLVTNAVESRGESGGSLTIETGREGDNAYVRVSDTGPGFTEEAAARVLEPYFTTKATGTGLGMAIADRIVTEHGGFITASNRPEGGAQVVVKLPLTGGSHKEVVR